MIRWWCVVLLGCGSSTRTVESPTNETVGELAKPKASNFCTGSREIGNWASELFPGCPPIQYRMRAPICTGAVCAQPCRVTSGGSSGGMGQFRHEYVRTYQYDARGRFVRETFDGNVADTCTWDGERLASCERDGAVTKAERDGTGRLLAIVSDAKRTALQYDERGRVTAIGDHQLRYDDNGWVVQDGKDPITYDAEGRVIQVGPDDPPKADEENHHRLAHKLQYKDGRLFRFDGPGYRNGSWQFDAQGRLEHSRYAEMESGGSTLFEYDCK